MGMFWKSRILFDDMAGFQAVHHWHLEINDDLSSGWDFFAKATVEPSGADRH